MSHSENESYTCPYCRWSHSHTWIEVREEEETIDTKFIGASFGKMHYLDTKRKFKVKICHKCHISLKIRGWIIGILIVMFFIGGGVSMLGAIGVPVLKNIEIYSIGVWFGSGFVLFMFWLLWKILAPSRAHVTYDRADKCNALVPYNS